MPRLHFTTDEIPECGRVAGVGRERIITDRAVFDATPERDRCKRCSAVVAGRPAVWCVAWTLDDGEKASARRPKAEWCAHAKDEPHDEAAFNVPTKCGHWVTLPVGCEKREPTCKWCRKALGLA